MIRKVDGKFVLYTASGKKRRLGTHDSRAQAEAQEAAIKIAKAKRKGK